MFKQPFRNNLFHGMIHDKEQGIIYLFGGRIHTLNTKQICDIWRYIIKENKWELFVPLTLPKPMSHFGYVYHEKQKM